MNNVILGHISDQVLKSVNAFILLLANGFQVHRNQRLHAYSDELVSTPWRNTDPELVGSFPDRMFTSVAIELLVDVEQRTLCELLTLP